MDESKKTQTVFTSEEPKTDPDATLKPRPVLNTLSNKMLTEIRQVLAQPLTEEEKEHMFGIDRDLEDKIDKDPHTIPEYVEAIKKVSTVLREAGVTDFILFTCKDGKVFAEVTCRNAFLVPAAFHMQELISKDKNANMFFKMRIMEQVMLGAKTGRQLRDAGERPEPITGTGNLFKVLSEALKR